MAGNQLTSSEKPARSAAWSGTVVILVAIFGIDSAIVGQASTWRHSKSEAAVIRSAVPACGSPRGAAVGGLAAAAGALAILLLLGRQTLDVARKAVVVDGPSSGPACGSVPPPRFRTSVSYHFGGLYGP